MIIRQNVTCPRCIARLQECPTNKHGRAVAWRRFNVGNIARAELGHAFYHTDDGKIALCIAKREVETK